MDGGFGITPALINLVIFTLGFSMSLIPNQKQFLPALLVLAFPFSTFADATLVFGSTGEGKTQPSHQIHLKAGKVSIANANDKRLLVYDSATNTASVVDHGKKEVAELNRAAFEEMAAELIETQRLVLEEMEGKLRDLPKEKREELRRVMEVLHRSNDPDSAGKAGELRFETTGKTGEWLGKKVKRANVYLREKMWGTALIADGASIGLSAEDFSAALAFQRYFDSVTKGLPAAVGQLFGKSGIVTEDGQLIVKLDQEKSGDEPAESIGLLRIDHEPVESGWFEVPSDFAKTSLKPHDPAAESEKKTDPEATEN